MITSTPQAAAAATRNMELPSGDDERVIGFGVMGLPSPAATIRLPRLPCDVVFPAYKSVWHRDPDGVWTFYATTRGQQSCSRFLSSATPVDPVDDIAAIWVTPWSLLISVDGLLDWRVDIKTTKATRVLSAIAGRIPRCMDEPQPPDRDEPDHRTGTADRCDPVVRKPAQWSGISYRARSGVGGRRRDGCVQGDDLGPSARCPSRAGWPTSICRSRAPVW
jgi:hypothetical protein